MNAGETSLTRTPATFERCEGVGIDLSSDPAPRYWGTAICPVCHSVVRVDDECRVDEHEVRVIDV